MDDQKVTIIEFAKRLKIKNAKNGVVQFEPYEFQSNLLEELHNNNLNIIWKSRQMGVSTIEMIVALYYMKAFNNEKVLLLTPHIDMSYHMIEMIRRMYYSVDDTKPDINSKNCIKLANGGGIEVKSSSTLVIKAERDRRAFNDEQYSLIIVDEAAYIDKLETLYDVCKNHLLKFDGSMIISSTKREDDDYFMTMFKDALRLKNKFNPIALDWTLLPQADEDWKAKQQKLVGKEEFERQYEIF